MKKRTQDINYDSVNIEVYFWELILFTSPIQLLWKTESETMFGPKHKSISLTTLLRF